MADQTPIRPAHARRGRPRKTEEERPVIKVDVLEEHKKFVEKRAREMGLPTNDFMAWASYVVSGRPVPEYIQKQLDAHARRELQERLVS